MKETEKCLCRLPVSGHDVRVGVILRWQTPPDHLSSFDRAIVWEKQIPSH